MKSPALQSMSVMHSNGGTTVAYLLNTSSASRLGSDETPPTSFPVSTRELQKIGFAARRQHFWGYAEGVFKLLVPHGARGSPRRRSGEQGSMVRPSENTLRKNRGGYLDHEVTVRKPTQNSWRPWGRR